MSDYEDIQVWCPICREVILLTSDKFLPGVEYNGAMFKSLHNDSRVSSDPVFAEWNKRGDLSCPRAPGIHGFLLERPMDGGLLTEHGIVLKGQETVDKTFRIVYGDEEPALKGMMKSPHIMSLEVGQTVIPIEAPAETTLIEEGEPPLDFPEEIAEPDEPEEKLTKEYICGICGESFDKGWKKAVHTKQCKKKQQA